MAAIMDTILIEMSKVWKHTDKGSTMVNRPWHKLTWSTAPGELTIEGLQKAAVAATVDIVSKCFSNSESPCHPNAYHQVLAQSDLPFGSRWGLIFKMATLGSTQISDQNNFSNSESLCHSDASNQVWSQSPLWFGRRCVLKNFKMAPWQPSWCRNGTNLAVLNLHVSPVPPTKFQLNLTCRSSANVVSRFKIFKLAAMAAILDIGMVPI